MLHIPVAPSSQKFTRRENTDLAFLVLLAMKGELDTRLIQAFIMVHRYCTRGFAESGHEVINVRFNNGEENKGKGTEKARENEGSGETGKGKGKGEGKKEPEQEVMVQSHNFDMTENTWFV